MPEENETHEVKVNSGIGPEDLKRFQIEVGKYIHLYWDVNLFDDLGKEMVLDGMIELAQAMKTELKGEKEKQG